MRALPLRALLTLRARAALDARAALGHALRVEEEARRRCDAVRRLTEALADREAEARRGLGVDPSGAAVLQAASRFVERLRREALSIEVALRASEDAVGDAARAVEHGRELLAAAQRALRDMERRRERWERVRRREVERLIESDAEDVLSARRAAP